MLEQDALVEVDNLLDKPITGSSKDLLGFRQLAITLATVVLSQSNASTITLGIDGPWGSGKSSILQLLKEELQQRSINHECEGCGTNCCPFFSLAYHKPNCPNCGIL